MSNEEYQKRKKKKKAFSRYKFAKCLAHNFLISCSILGIYSDLPSSTNHSKLYKSSLKSTSNKAMFKECFNVWLTATNHL
jgi:hypothetical protein